MAENNTENISVCVFLCFLFVYGVGLLVDRVTRMSWMATQAAAKKEIFIAVCMARLTTAQLQMILTLMNLHHAVTFVT